MTDKYDPKNEEHRTCKHKIEVGDGLPDLVTTREVLEALKKTGFEILEEYDVAAVAERYGNDIPWYATLQGGWSISSFKHTRVGR